MNSLVKPLTCFVILWASIINANAFKPTRFTEKQLEDIQMQIYLDQKHFGPGVLDGKPGRYTRMAIQAYNLSNGNPIDDETQLRAAAKENITNIFALATVPATADKPLMDGAK